MALPASRMRIIALSATLPNIEDIGAFIGAEIFFFGNEHRPVPLQVRAQPAVHSWPGRVLRSHRTSSVPWMDANAPGGR